MPGRASFESGGEEEDDEDGSELEEEGASGLDVDADGEDEDEVCGICRTSFDMTCSNSTCLFPGEPCPPAWGVCGHQYHLHCIEKWLLPAAGDDSRKQQCPMCRADWAYRS